MIKAIETLKKHNQWVAWKYEQRNGKQTKVLKNPKTGGNASSTNSNTWASHQAATKAINRFQFDGIGFVFSTNDDFCGIDLDDCLNPDTGQLADWAAQVVAEMDSYTEISPSGHGLKIFFRGTTPGNRRRDDIEIYHSLRYFTVTGEHWTDSPTTINERTEQATVVYARFFPEPEPINEPGQAIIDLDDQDLIQRAVNAANGSKFAALWNGNDNGYHSRSEAHLALCNMLAFWTGGDKDRIDSLFRQSGFYRDYADKWDQRHSGDGRTYGEMTIEKALANTTIYYTPSKNGHQQRSKESALDDEIDLDTPDPESSTVPFYSAENGRIIYTTWKTVSGEIIPVRQIVAPFVGHIKEKITIYDEFDQQVIYVITGTKGRSPFTAKVTADEWADSKKLVSAILRYLPGKPPETNPNLRNHWGPALSALTDEHEMKQIKAVPSTGWTPDGKAFVMPNGSVGQGYVCQLDQNMEYELSHFGLNQSIHGSNRTALAALLDLIKVYKPAVIYTLLAHSFLPPLLRWVGDEARYLYHIHADTGSFKTELGKIIMALYGPTGTAGITYKWSNTPYGAESRAHSLKDCLMLLDDLKPGTINESDKAKWVAFIQAAVDALGRKRATRTGTAATSLPPRALIISTGEAIPEAGEASYTARMLLAQLNRQPKGRNYTLDHIKSRVHLLSGLMYEYIEWLLDGDGQDVLNQYKNLQNEAIVTQHTRLAANFASNRLGAVMFVKFCQDRSYMTLRIAEIFLKRHLDGLNEIVKRTDLKAHSERYSQRFITALQDALSTGFAKLADDLIDRRVGWQDEQYIYLLSGAKEIVDQWLRQSGQTTIYISKKDLRKQLYDDLLTFSTPARQDAGQYDYQAIDPATGTKQMVIAMYKENLILNSQNENEAHDLHDLHDLGPK